MNVISGDWHQTEDWWPPSTLILMIVHLCHINQNIQVNCDHLD